MPVKAIDIILGAESHCNVSAHKNPTKAAQIAPIDNASTKGASLSLRIKVKFIASAKATPNPKIKPNKLVKSSITCPLSFPSIDVNNPPNTTVIVITVNFESGSFRIIFDKTAAKIGTVATPISTTATGAKEMARLNNVAFSIWQMTRTLKLSVKAFRNACLPLTAAQIEK